LAKTFLKKTLASVLLEGTRQRFFLKKIFSLPRALLETLGKDLNKKLFSLQSALLEALGKLKKTKLFYLPSALGRRSAKTFPKKNLCRVPC